MLHRTKVLSDEEVARAKEWLNSKGVSNRCESCGQDDWVPGPVVRAVGVDIADGTADWDHASIPMFQMLCQNCGYIRNYSASLMGLL